MQSLSNARPESANADRSELVLVCLGMIAFVAFAAAQWFF
jgi:hypothetical protein